MTCLERFVGTLHPALRAALCPKGWQLDTLEAPGAKFT